MTYFIAWDKFQGIGAKAAGMEGGEGRGMGSGRWVDWGGVSWGDRVPRHGDVLGCVIWGWLSLHSVWAFIALVDIYCM